MREVRQGLEYRATVMPPVAPAAAPHRTVIFIVLQSFGVKQ
jgi:hypothetical protein